MLTRRFDSFEDLFRRFETDLTDLFGRAGEGWSARDGRLVPSMEILKTDGDIVVRMELPGVDPDSMDVTLQDRTLRVRAERRVSNEEDALHREFVQGTFERAVVLPSEIDPDKLSARYEAGILEVRIPYSAPKAVKVPVEIASGETPALKAAS